MGWLLSEPKRRYIEAAKTDVMALWRKHGWIDPAKDKQAQARFKLNETGGK